MNWNSHYTNYVAQTTLRRLRKAIFHMTARIREVFIDKNQAASIAPIRGSKRDSSVQSLIHHQRIISFPLKKSVRLGDPQILSTALLSYPPCLVEDMNLYHIASLILLFLHAHR
jgi:hypothetical protein